ncbi:sulfurtransferase [Marinihelvus fidelis]|uniref:Sulfurtransferase n=1 Tax=Marinihelvus fidelis TaxID=2613842 RepID=A0A5N0TDL0_9GAMM|nr:sulfurtransferase [Marinihelvus fidelis]KAA9132554.1 sulfurtransferase [Marinihelvus fidelis]
MLITARELAGQAGPDAPLVVDCRFNLADPDAGQREWRQARIPGAVYAHLDDDLAGPVTAQSGRHPLPGPERFASFLSRSGWQPGRHMVAYDAQGGAFAARLWWLMRYFGHDTVRLLDGGWSAWVRAALPIEQGEPAAVEPSAGTALVPDPSMVVNVDGLAEDLESKAVRLLDARGADRFEGRNEAIDPVAGHVPGAHSAPFTGNLAEGVFLSPADLAARFTALLDGRAPAEVVHMCGSGVTACHNLYAMEYAGLAGSRLYPGSWSEWIRDPQRPVAVTSSPG